MYRYESLLVTADNQFGYKQSLSTELCIFTFKEIVSCYHSQSSNVFISFLDASKAFDKVNHWLLFDKLLKRGIPKLIVRFLITWYSTQTFAVKWCNFISNPFNVSNGVRQGGILSPKLFNVFIDELSIRLNSSKIGCHLNGTCLNHLQYADDAIIMSPSPTGLQKLLDICNTFAIESDMVFNSKKTVCMRIKYKSKCDTKIPNVYLNGQVLKWVSDHKYLGVYINELFKDDRDIKRQMCAMYCKGNTLVRKFKQCNVDVKTRLFQTFCSNMYCAQLWCNYTNGSFKQLYVSYNNVFRYLLNIRGEHSISQIFINHNIDSFNVLYRKLTYGLLKRIECCKNLLIHTITTSMYFLYDSLLYKHWQKVLLNL